MSHIGRKIFCGAIVFCLAAIVSAASAAEVFQTGARVNFRTGPSLDASIIKTLDRNLAVDVLSYDAEGWSKISLNGTDGYVKSEYLIRTQIPDASLDTPEVSGASETSAPSANADSFASPASYRTTTRVNFRTGPSLGASVIRTLNPGVLVQALEYDAENWSKVSIGQTIGYIKSEYLINADTYAGAVSAAGVELTDWSVVKGLFTLYTPVQIIDVRTGLSYYVQSFSNGLHADVEPLTKADTDILLKTYGGKWKWDPRPVWVALDGRLIAASINGMPHGGGTIADNGMNGQVCLHFLNSKPHNGNQTFEKDHQNGVLEAWNAAR